MNYEKLDSNWEDDGTMPANLDELREAIIGHRITHVEKGDRSDGIHIVLDNNLRVKLTDGGDCCAYTVIDDYVYDIDKRNHVITGIDTQGGYTLWHIYSELGDVLQLEVGWSCGNPFYYGYGFNISIEPETIVIGESKPQLRIE